MKVLIVGGGTTLYFLCRILGEDGEPDGREFVVWTTTPWTVPGPA